MTQPPARPRRVLALLGWVLFALALTVVLGGVWSALLLANLGTTPRVPWAIVVMAPVLWAVWAYLGGSGAPARTSETRRRLRRARRLPASIFWHAVGAGALAIAALVGFWNALADVAGMPGNALPDFSQYPTLTVALTLGMASLVNAVGEEVALRGYLQGELERSVGGPAAIALTALAMAPAHAATQGFVWPTFAFYLAVDAMLGTTAWLTDSILPGIAIHAGGILVFFTLVWPGGAVGRGGGPGLHAAQTAIFTALALWAFRGLAAAPPARSGPA